MRRNDRGQKRASALSTAVALAAFLALHSNCLAGIKQLQPGFNLFTPQQDVELGKDAAAERERQLPLLRNADVDQYINVLLRKLEQSRYARSLKPDGSRAEMFPFQIRAVASKTVNAFSLPGGPIFVNSGTFAASDESGIKTEPSGASGTVGGRAGWTFVVGTTGTDRCGVHGQFSVTEIFAHR